MTVRPATPSDAEQVAAIYAHYVEQTAATFDEEAPGAAEMAARIERIGALGLPFVVAEDGGAIQGFAYLGRYKDRSGYRYTVEDSVYAAPHARGRGVGRALLDRVLTDGEQAGMRKVIAVIAVTDDPASTALHRSLGFREAGLLEQVGFKHGRWHDVRFMQRSLPR